MKWGLIKKGEPDPPTVRVYTQWKKCIAREGMHRCVYCGTPDQCFGTSRNYHIDHYRPRAKFPDLREDYQNLFYACSVCNSFKSDDWEEDDSSRKYPDPTLVDYSTIFAWDPETGLLRGEPGAASYLIARLHLNRPFLLLERRIYRLRTEAIALCQDLKGKGLGADEGDAVIRILEILHRLDYESHTDATAHR